MIVFYNPKDNDNKEQDANSQILDSSDSPLKGKELLAYIENNREELDDNGDELCIGAGYGSLSNEGSPICKLELFSKELINAKKEQHIASTKARKEILNSYSFTELKSIAEKGCISGDAIYHLQISENEQFFDDNREEIILSLEDQFGQGYIANSAQRIGGDNSHWKHRAVWRFIEMIASEEVDKKNFK